ncbi:hypothetical protein [Acidithrix sp. C25]|nr:hypothetical protein [Acidithrix sp. C25]
MDHIEIEAAGHARLYLMAVAGSWPQLPDDLDTDRAAFEAGNPT